MAAPREWSADVDAAREERLSSMQCRSQQPALQQPGIEAQLGSEPLRGDNSSSSGEQQRVVEDAPMSRPRCTRASALDDGGHAPLAMPDRGQRDELFRRFDFNGNGMLSLAEIDKAVVELWPQFDHKRALMRAYKAADRDDDGFIKRREFRLLLKYIMYFDEMWAKFDEIDRDHDHRLTPAEFEQGCATMGIRLTRSSAAAEFAAMDENGGGFILFDEFCHWCARRQVHVESEGLTAEECETLGGPTDGNSMTGESDAPDIELSAAEQEEIRHKIYATLLAPAASLNESTVQARSSAKPAELTMAETGLKGFLDDAEACRVKGSWRAAAESYGQALGIAQRDDVAIDRADVAELHNRRGMVLHQLGDDESAVAAYTAGIDAAASSPRATLYCHRGLSRSRLGQLAAAEKDLRRAVELGGAAPNHRAVAELAEVSRARRSGMDLHAKSPPGASTGGTRDGDSKRRGADLELPHDITPITNGSPDSQHSSFTSPRSALGSKGHKKLSPKAAPRVRTRVSAQEARTKARVCAATGQSILPAGRGVRLLQEISSIATSYDDIELKALAKAALSEREEATAKWQRELTRLRQQSKRQRQDMDELRKSKDASVAEAAAARRQSDERVEAVRRHCDKMLREGRAKQQAAVRKRVDEVNLNCQQVLSTALASFRQLVNNVTNEVANAAGGTSSPAGTGLTIRNELLSRFDILASGIDAAFSEQQGSTEFLRSQASSPVYSETEVLGTSRSRSVSPIGRSIAHKSGGTEHAAIATVWHNDSIIGGSQTGLGIYSSDKQPSRPSPSKATLGPPPPTRTAVLLGLHDGADIPATGDQLTTPVHQIGRMKAPVVLTTEAQEAATKAVAAREAQWAAAAIQSFSASFENASPTTVGSKNVNISEMTLENQFHQFEKAKQRLDAPNEPENDDAAPTRILAQAASHNRSGPVRPPRRSNGESPPQNNTTQQILRQREAEAKLLVSDDITLAKQKLRSMSYTSHGQDPVSLLNMYDKDRSGQLSWAEFKAAVRKGGKLTATGPHGLSDVQLRRLFSAVDGDHSGTVSINELTKFVWGNENLLGEHSGISIESDAAKYAAPPPDDLAMPTHGPLALPTDMEQEAAFDRVDTNGNGSLSLAEIDKAVVEIWPTFDHKKALMRAYKAADLSGDGYIGRREFPHLLKYLVYFNNLWKQFEIIDSDHDGRLDVKEMHEASQMLGLDLSWTKTVEEFGRMDTDGGGYVRFDEFCAWCARNMHGTSAGEREEPEPELENEIEDEGAQHPDEIEVEVVDEFSDVNEDEGERHNEDEDEDEDGHIMRVTCPDGVGPGEAVRCACSIVSRLLLPCLTTQSGWAVAGYN